MNFFTKLWRNFARPIVEASAVAEVNKVAGKIDSTDKLDPVEKLLADEAEQALLQNSLNRFHITVDPTPAPPPLTGPADILNTQ